MLHEYFNLFFPLCSLAVSLLIFIVYFSKKNVKNTETKFYSILLIFTLIESIFTLCLTLSVHLFFNNNTLMYFAIANKILYIIYIIWISLLFLYFASLTYKEKEQLLVLKMVIVTINIILTILIIFLPISLIYLREEKISNSYGPSAIILYIGCTLYVFLMIIISLINFKNNSDKKKYIPLVILILLMVIILIIRVIDPYFNATSNVLSFIALIMYFTIENPDLKMLNELQLAQAQVEKSNKIKTEFLSSMSHEIRTPLNSIVGYSQLIETSKTLKDAKENAKEVISSSNVLLKMFENIVDTYKLENNEILLSNKKYNFLDEISKILNIYEQKTISKGIIFNVKIDKNIPYLYGDINIIKKILINLLDNALTYTDKGKISVKITKKCENKNCQLKMEIIDTGEGIEKIHLKSIFEMFDRGSYKNSSISGIGLGLYITKKLVDLIDGQINIESILNKGTKIKICINQQISD